MVETIGYYLKASDGFFLLVEKGFKFDEIEQIY